VSPQCSFKLSLTYYAIDYEGQVTTPALNDPRDILMHEVEWASVITRNPTGAQIALICGSREFLSSLAACLTNRPAAIVDLRLANLGSTRTSGLDMDMRAHLNTDMGGFGLRVVGSEVFHFDQAATIMSPTVDILNTLGNPPRTRLRATVDWSQPDASAAGFGAQVGVDYTGGYSNIGSTLVPNVAPWTTFDLQLRYRTPSGHGWWSTMELVLSAVNVFDQSPSFVDDPYGYDVANIQPLGRVLSFYFSKLW